MPPFLALVLTCGLIVYLFRQDKREYADISVAVWLPLIWMMISASRLPSQWLQWEVAGSAAQAYEEGNDLDRILFLILILLSIYVLYKRRVQWSRLLQAELPLMVFLGYCFLSFLWSDFPFITFKRWFRDLGIYLTILVAVTDTRHVEAVRLLFRRFAYFLLPLSITLIKYFPEIGMGYDGWTGQKHFLGVTTNKNMLGSLCLVSGLFFVWDTLRRWKHRANDRKMICINLCLLGSVLWLLERANSATSLICLFFGTGLLLLSQLPALKRNPKRIPVLIFLGVLSFFPLDFIFDLSSMIAGSTGRDTTFTGRTEVWEDIRKEAFSPFIGAGYESFWLGDRLKRLWSIHHWMPNQAHNGYLEIYINLGMIGLTLLCIFLLSTFIQLSNSLATEFPFGIFGLLLLCSLLLYNVTEAAFKSHICWYASLVLIIELTISNMLQTKESKNDLLTNERPTGYIPPWGSPKLYERQCCEPDEFKE